jgi:pyrimidine deaminase RibD-like protein/ADP-ribose pyrophosphatase YjhB (NUDIX family)/RNA-binding protein YhbY
MNHNQEPTMVCRKVSVILISLLLWSHIQAFQITIRIRCSGSTHILRAPCSSTRCLNALTKQDEEFTQQAIEYAQIGFGHTFPNPTVGCVLVNQESNEVIGSGFHPRAGYPHAEVFALFEAAGHVSSGVDAAKSVLNGEDDGSIQKLVAKYASENGPEELFGEILELLPVTAYVTLEPCCHYGKNPPCAATLALSKVDRVVVGFRDPNPRAGGGGVKVLEEAGIEVEMAEGSVNAACASLVTAFVKRSAPRGKDLSWISGNMRLALRSLAGSKSVNGTLHQVNWGGEKAADEDSVEKLLLNATWLEQVDALLWDHELVKLQLNLARGEKKLAKKLSERIAAQLNAHIAQTVGDTALLYRPGIPPVLDLKALETEKLGIDLRKANGFVCVSSSSEKTVDFARDLARKQAQEKRKEGQLHHGHADYVCTLSKRTLRKIPRKFSEKTNSRATDSVIKRLCQQGIPAETTDRVKVGYHLRSFLGISSDLDFVSDETYWLVLVYRGTHSNNRRCWIIDMPGGKKELDETTFECAIRETEEEMSLQIDETWKLEENPRQTRIFNGNSYFFLAPPAEMLQSPNLDIPAERVRQEHLPNSFVCVSSSDQQTVDFARDLARQGAEEKRKKGKLERNHAQYICTISKRTMWETMGKRFTRQQKGWAKEFLVAQLSQQGVPVKPTDTVTFGFHLLSLLRISDLDSALDRTHWLVLVNRENTRSSTDACCWTIDLPNRRTQRGETTFECAARATETEMSLQIDERWKLEGDPRINQSHKKTVFFFVAPPAEMLASLNDALEDDSTFNEVG